MPQRDTEDKENVFGEFAIGERPLSTAYLSVLLKGMGLLRPDLSGLAMTETGTFSSVN